MSVACFRLLLCFCLFVFVVFFYLRDDTVMRWIKYPVFFPRHLEDDHKYCLCTSLHLSLKLTELVPYVSPQHQQLTQTTSCRQKTCRKSKAALWPGRGECNSPTCRSCWRRSWNLAALWAEDDPWTISAAIQQPKILTPERTCKAV